MAATKANIKIHNVMERVSTFDAMAKCLLVL